MQPQLLLTQHLFALAAGVVNAVIRGRGIFSKLDRTLVAAATKFEDYQKWPVVFAARLGR